MKKILSLTYAFLFIASVQALAQEKPKSFIGLSGGISLPMGNFTKTDYTDPSSGFSSKTGLNFGLEGAKYLKGSNWGIGGSLSYATYNFKPNNLSAGFLDDFGVATAKVSADSYRTLQILVGPYHSIPLGKLTADFKGLVGIMSATSPEITTTLEDNPPFCQKSATATALSFQIGAGLRYSFNEKLGVSLRTDYFYGKPKFDLVNENRNNNVGRKIDSYNESISGICATAGLFYQFTK